MTPFGRRPTTGPLPPPAPMPAAVSSIDVVGPQTPAGEILETAATVAEAIIAGKPEPEVYDSLTLASMARQKLWGDKDPMFAGIELGGEAGELLEQAIIALHIGARTGRALNTVKKLERERMGMVGATDTVEALGDELGDVVICCEILARKYGLSLEYVTAKKFNKTSTKYGFPIFMREVL